MCNGYSFFSTKTNKVLYNDYTTKIFYFWASCLHRSEYMKLHEIITQKQLDKEFTMTLLVKEVYRTPEGLHLFTVTDGNDSIKLSIYKAGQSLHEDVVSGVVRSFSFKTKLFQGSLQGDLKNINKVAESAAQTFLDTVESAKMAKYAPKDEKLLIESEAMKLLRPSMLTTASIIRQAVIEQRPIHITHHGDCDGYSAGILLEKSIRSLIQRYHPHEKYMNQYIKRVPSKPPFYDLGDATKDVNFFMNDGVRFGTKLPLIIITDNGSTKQDIVSIQKVKMYGADVLVIDHHDPGLISDGKSAVCEHVASHVNPHLLGITESLSASMLCYQVAYYVNRHDEPNVTVAAIGGVDDWCQGETIDKMVAASKLEREYLFEVGFFVNYEIYLARMNVTQGGLFTLLYGSVEERDALIALYKPFFEENGKQVAQSVEAYGKAETWNTKKVGLFDAEEITLWGDYYTIGKVADVCKEVFTPDIVVAHSNSMVVFRANEDSGFDTNVVLKQLRDALPHARVSGGGHAVAGSLKFLPIAKQEVLAIIKKYVEELT